MNRCTGPGRAIVLATVALIGACPAARGQGAERRGAKTDGGPRITYHDGASALFQEHCVACHDAGGIAPFALTSSDDVRARLSRVRRAIEERRMPPWFANPEYGVWKNDRRLSDDDRDALLAWIDAGAPEGEPSTRTERAYTRPSGARTDRPEVGWALGEEPDTVIALPRAMEIPADGVLPYQYLFVKTGYAEDRWIRGVALRPTANGVVHHTAAFLQGPDDLQRGPYLALWTGRTQPTVYAKGIARRLPAGAWIMFEVHYAPDGEPTTDRTELALLFADGPPEREAATLAVATREFAIPPRAASHPVVAEMSFRRGGSLLSLLRHMHIRGKAFRYELERADGSTEILLDIPDYDFRWQLRYEFATPVRIEAGDILRGRAWYDNSAANPDNPDSGATVHHGLQGFEEMMAGFFEWVADPVDVNVARPRIILPDTSSATDRPPHDH